MTVVSNVRAALSRKFGPLPVWAWALLAGAGIFLYRTMHGQYAAVPAGTGTDASADLSDGSAGGAGDPVTLAPGESVYNPATGQLVSTAPEQQPPNVPDPTDPAERPLPVTLEPGESVYDPATGGFLSNVKAKAKAKVKRKKKPKPHHKPSKPKHPGHKGHAKPKPHGHGIVKHKTHTPKRAAAKPKPKPRRVPGLHPAKPKPKAARHAAPKHPAVRQRPAASHPKPHPASKAHPKATPHKKKRK